MREKLELKGLGSDFGKKYRKFKNLATSHFKVTLLWG